MRMMSPWRFLEKKQKNNRKNKSKYEEISRHLVLCDVFEDVMYYYDNKLDPKSTQESLNEGP